MYSRQQMRLGFGTCRRNPLTSPICFLFIGRMCERPPATRRDVNRPLRLLGGMLLLLGTLHL